MKPTRRYTVYNLTKSTTKPVYTGTKCPDYHKLGDGLFDLFFAYGDDPYLVIQYVRLTIEDGGNNVNEKFNTTMHIPQVTVSQLDTLCKNFNEDCRERDSKNKRKKRTRK